MKIGMTSAKHADSPAKLDSIHGWTWIINNRTSPAHPQLQRVNHLLGGCVLQTFHYFDHITSPARLSDVPHPPLSHLLAYPTTSSTAQGGGGSFKNRKPIGEIDCCESRMAERIHWLTERWLELCLLEWLQWLQWSPHPQLLDVVWCTATVVVVVA